MLYPLLVNSYRTENSLREISGISDRLGISRLRNTATLPGAITPEADERTDRASHRNEVKAFNAVHCYQVTAPAELGRTD